MDTARGSWGSYCSIYNLGHRAVQDLLNYPHVCEEKIDGSQFSFGMFDIVADGTDADFFGPNTELRVRSKGAQMHVDAPEKMFTKAVDSVKQRQHLLHVGWTYRCEYLQKPKHNTLAYDRIPEGHLIVFDVSTGDQTWLPPWEKEREAKRIGLECVPVLNSGLHCVPGLISTCPMTLELLRHTLDTQQSVLGGQLIEGVVIKPLVELYGVDKKTLMGKFVSERFREAHKQAWKETSPNSGDILEKLVKTYRAEGRWLKAAQHLREAGLLEDSPRDIPKLMNEVKKDTGQEEKDAIMRLLYRWAWPHIERGIVAGLPEWWKDVLLKKQFEDVTELPSDMHAGEV
jgi:hypothetical protein